MAKKKDRKPPSIEDQEAAKRLFVLWEKHKTEKKIIQAEAAEKIGDISQGAFGQYIRGEISLGLEAALRFANYFEVPLEVIKDFDVLKGGYNRITNASASSEPSSHVAETIPKEETQLPIATEHEDENICAVLKIMENLDPSVRGRARGRLEEFVENNIRPEGEERRKANDFTGRTGT